MVTGEPGLHTPAVPGLADQVSRPELATVTIQANLATEPTAQLTAAHPLKKSRASLLTALEKKVPDKLVPGLTFFSRYKNGVFYQQTFFFRILKMVCFFTLNQENGT